MKTYPCLILSTALCLSSVQAQVGRPGGLGAPAPGPGLSGSTVKLFGDNSSFSANLEMQTAPDAGAEAMTFPGKLSFDQGKSRFDSQNRRG